MHPNPLFRSNDRKRLEALIGEVSFGTVFLTTPDGPRAAHVPLLSDGSGRVRFHLARNNALTPHLFGARALITVNGPDGYVSPRWYDNRDTVPTWDYVALEMEGPVSRLDDEALERLLHDVIETFEERLPGTPWIASESSERVWAGLFKGIVGFELNVREWRPTFKVSQKKSSGERERIARGLEAAGNPRLAEWVREYAA
ncbi:MAG: FMN-binding negative transcriptional regulator [Erythrobacter sp.]|nr:FMN-binding negative transcriptional regulator [Erythrobacter sp.]